MKLKRDNKESFDGDLIPSYVIPKLVNTFTTFVLFSFFIVVCTNLFPKLAYLIHLVVPNTLMESLQDELNELKFENGRLELLNQTLSEDFVTVKDVTEPPSVDNDLKESAEKNEKILKYIAITVVVVSTSALGYVALVQLGFLAGPSIQFALNKTLGVAKNDSELSVTQTTAIIDLISECTRALQENNNLSLNKLNEISQKLSNFVDSYSFFRNTDRSSGISPPQFPRINPKDIKALIDGGSN